ncbi:MAG TPA: pyridoxamine 5'-phosphate oxidase family protein [Solirubrobacteraceae bacterium]|nr:pyridoxamine 5'-phosphate oxidase family protein [Solirubrobacteraceae bacterium]
MAHVYDTINDHLAGWIARQSMFFVGSAPLTPDGHVNISPKGPIGSLRVLGPAAVAYLDIYGSGSETIAHLRENGRIVVMLCAFEGPPRIVRLHGRGVALRPGDEGFDALLEQAAFEDPSIPEARRSIVRVDVTRISDSCGYGVPLMEYEGQRPHSTLSAQKRLRTKGPEGYAEFVAERNAESLDGMPAIDAPTRVTGT